MLLTAHQPCYFPWIGFFAKAARADVFIFMDWVQLNHQSWQTRNRVLSVNGPVWLIVPVVTRGRFGQSIRDTEIRGDSGWKRKHFATISQCYSKTPFFGEYAPYLEGIYKKDWPKLSDLNIATTEYLFDCFGIKPVIRYGGEFDYKRHKTDLLIEMCRSVGADRYLSSDGERAYVEPEKLAAAGIAHEYMDYLHPEYPQLRGPFVPCMSALDILFNCGPAARGIIISGFGEAKSDG